MMICTHRPRSFMRIVQLCADTPGRQERTSRLPGEGDALVTMLEARRSAGNQFSQDRYRDLAPERLVRAALERDEGALSSSGALVVTTGTFTGRSPDDKYVVLEPASSGAIWWGEVNRPISEIHFDRLAADVRKHLDGTTTFEQHLRAGEDPDYSYPVHLLTERAWVALFARHLFLDPDANGHDVAALQPISILHAPGFEADPDRHGTDSSTAVALHMDRRQIVIAGTAYAGEVKKSVFTLMQYLLPMQDVLTMHCSANIGESGSPTLFFGLSGTGKTTLSNDPRRQLIGDDEHAWTERGIFNIEGGCYAKTIDLSARDEPGIFRAANHPATVLENVMLDPATGEPDFANTSLTENTRAAFPLDVLPNAAPAGRATHPGQVVLLTADASGVLPPVSRLNKEQAIALFLLGFTSKIPGTERGLDTPEATFSPCFGAPFLPLVPERYANLVARRIDEHQPSLWLVNTGWTGGSFATGSRISIAHTRRIVRAITDRTIENATFREDPVFKVMVPESLDDIPVPVLRPRTGWNDPDAYDREAYRLRDAFRTQAETQGIDPAWTGWLRG